MALFLLLIILLAVAWGLADYQLQSRVEVPPPAAVSKPVPAKPEPTAPASDTATNTPAPSADAGGDQAADDRPAAAPPSDPAKD